MLTIAKKMHPSPKPKPVRPTQDVETEESVLPPASSPNASSQISHSQDISDSKSRLLAPAWIRSDEDVVYEEDWKNDDEDDDVNTEQDDDIIIQEEEYVFGPNVVSPQTLRTKKGETGNVDKDETEVTEEDGYEDENESEEEGSGREGVFDYEEDIEVSPQPQVRKGDDRIEKSLSPAPEGADVEEAVVLTSEEENEEKDAPHDQVDARQDEVDKLRIAPSLPSSPPSGQVEPAATAAAASEQSPEEEEARVDPAVIQMDPKSKTMIGMRLAQAVDAAPDTNTRSPELVPLTKDYEIFRKRLRTLISATKNYYEQTKKMEQARLQVVKEFSILSEQTPLFDHVGQPLDAEQLKSVEQRDGESLATSAQDFDISKNKNKPATNNVAQELSTSSMAALEQVSSMQADIALSEYQRRVIDYAVEWKQVVTSRIDKEIKEVNKLRKVRLHYEKKVEALRNKVNALEQKGKPVPETTATKLTRNEDKLSVRWKNHETSSGRLVVFMEEAVTYGWKDLYPLVKNAMSWEVYRLAQENETYGRLPMTLEAMELTFKQNVWMHFNTKSADSLEKN
jgi:tRNA(Ser,Leu) C12 N-acetylase TAN1